MNYTNIIIKLCLLSFPVISCNISSPDTVNAPEASIDPVVVETDAPITFTINTPTGIVLRFCGGVTYAIQRLESDEWITTGGQYGFCTTDKLPYIFVSDQINAQLRISEEGKYRLKTSYKLLSEDEWQKVITGQSDSIFNSISWTDLVSNTFQVANE